MRVDLSFCRFSLCRDRFAEITAVRLKVHIASGAGLKMSNYLRRLTLQFGTCDPNRRAISGRLVAPTVPIANLRRESNGGIHRIIRVISPVKRVQYFRQFQLARTNANHFLITSEHVFTASAHKAASQSCHDRTGNPSTRLRLLTIIVLLL